MYGWKLIIDGNYSCYAIFDASSISRINIYINIYIYKLPLRASAFRNRVQSVFAATIQIDKPRASGVWCGMYNVQCTYTLIYIYIYFMFGFVYAYAMHAASGKKLNGRHSQLHIQCTMYIIHTHTSIHLHWYMYTALVVLMYETFFCETFILFIFSMFTCMLCVDQFNSILFYSFFFNIYMLSTTW